MSEKTPSSAAGATRLLFGFHALGVRLKTAPQSILTLYFDPSRRDARMLHFLERVAAAGLKAVESAGAT